MLNTDLRDVEHHGVLSNVVALLLSRAQLDDLALASLVGNVAHLPVGVRQRLLTGEVHLQLQLLHERTVVWLDADELYRDGVLFHRGNARLAAPQDSRLGGPV